MSNYHNTRFSVPAATAGYLYYARLQTAFGPMYKLGFTSFSSIEERFAYKANGDERLLDRQFLFAFRDDAFSVEQQLHGYFSKKCAFEKYSSHPSLPLYKNGQSELYYEDILQLDQSYSKGQADKTRANLRTASARVSGDPWWWQPTILAIGLPFRIIFVSIAFMCKSAERVVDALRKAPPSERGTLFGGAAKHEQESVFEQQRQADVASLLDWVRANAIGKAFTHPVPVVAKPTTTPPEHRTGTGAPVHVGTSDNLVRSLAKESMPCAITSGSVAGAQLEDIVQQVSSYQNNAWLNMAHDLHQAMPLTVRNATVHVAGIYGLVTACAKLYQDKIIDKSTFCKMTDGLHAPNKLDSDEWTEALAQFENLARLYGLNVNAEKAKAVIDSFSPTFNLEEPGGVTIEEFAIDRTMRRVRLMVMRMHLKRIKR